MLKDKSKLAAGIGAALLLGAALVMWSPWSPDPTLASPAGKAYFTDDDGATWFADDADKLAPFTRDGKVASRAYLFRCGSGKPFANHLERYKPEAKALLEEQGSPTHKGPINAQAIKEANLGGREVKRPGDKSWTSSAGPRAGAITIPKCPDGNGEATPVEP